MCIRDRFKVLLSKVIFSKLNINSPCQLIITILKIQLINKDNTSLFKFIHHIEERLKHLIALPSLLIYLFIIIFLYLETLSQSLGIANTHAYKMCIRDRLLT